jgi:hypothetical protein
MSGGIGIPPYLVSVKNNFYNKVKQSEKFSNYLIVYCLYIYNE